MAATEYAGRIKDGRVGSEETRDDEEFADGK